MRGGDSPVRPQLPAARAALALVVLLSASEAAGGRLSGRPARPAAPRTAVGAGAQPVAAPPLIGNLQSASATAAAAPQETHAALQFGVENRPRVPPGVSALLPRHQRLLLVRLPGQKRTYQELTDEGCFLSFSQSVSLALSRWNFFKGGFRNAGL